MERNLKRCFDKHTSDNRSYNDDEQSAIWTPEQTIDVKKRRTLLSQQNTIPILQNNDITSSFASLHQSSVIDENCHVKTLKQQMSMVVSRGNVTDKADTKLNLTGGDTCKTKKKRQQRHNKQHVKKSDTKVVVTVTHECTQQSRETGHNVGSWSRENTSAIFDMVLSEAGKQGHEFSTLCALARTCKLFASIYALSPRSSVGLVMRYIDAYMRERVNVRKFEMENTPTKPSLEPYYKFREEKEERASSFCCVSGNGENATETETRWWKTTFTLTAPCVEVCMKGIDGVPIFSFSCAPDSAWEENRDKSVKWERVKTKNWSIRNPLVRMAAIHAQAHASCIHSKRTREWLERIKKQWALAKQRKVWKTHENWYNHPVLRVPLA